MKKILVLITISILILTTAAGCNQMAAIYGDDEKISEDSDTYGLEVASQSADGQDYTGEFKSMEGMGTIWTFDAKKDQELTMTYTISLNKGKAKLVLISPDKTVTTAAEIEKDSESSTVTLSIKKGKNRMKLVAKDAKQLKVKVSIPSGKIRDFGF